MKKRKGFTLIELLAVIVILGLLLAIAIPSVTKYITQSRKKTVTTTIGNYIGALTNQVNDMEYTFTESNTIYAVPIECIALERGGTNPFGEWMQASNSYWAYVLVQYDDATSSYTYGFTFKDSAGYGLYPITSEKLNESGKQIQQDLDLTRPTSGTITNITAKENWTGFIIDDDTALIVLEAASEGETGDGVESCTLCQKGKNYDAVEEEKATRGEKLSTLIFKSNPLVTAKPTLTNGIANTSDVDGLYVSTETNSGKPTYYFRGNVNIFVKFAGVEWKVVRINEDGTIRLMLLSRLNKTNYKFNSSPDNYMDMYYSNSDVAKPAVEEWYQTTIIDKGYDKYVSTGTFCEQAKVKSNENATSGNAEMKLYTDYIPDYRCETDGNGKGIYKAKAGLLSYDEIIHAGGYYRCEGANYFLCASYKVWTMSPSGFYYGALIWDILSRCEVSNYHAETDYNLRPVINLNANVTATGTGTSTDPYIVQTN